MKTVMRYGKPFEMATNAEEIRAMFPAPRSARDPDAGLSAYCIGGACVAAAGIGEASFPPSERVAQALTTINPALSKNRALNVATMLIRFNDASMFAEAWDLLRVALLAEQPEPPTCGPSSAA